jgi:hypothetical protein
MIADSLGALSFGPFLLAVLGSFALGATLVLALFLRKPAWVRWITRIELAGLALYGTLFLGASLTSTTRVLAPGQEKLICEVDCHLAYAVVGADTMSTYQGRRARGVFHIVAVQVRFDSSTIASWRPRDLPVSPNSRTIALIDGAGHRYPAAADSFQRSLIPGQSYRTHVLFDVPADATDLRLALTSGDWPTRLMIGHENAFLHGKGLFRLPA